MSRSLNSHSDICQRWKSVSTRFNVAVGKHTGEIVESARLVEVAVGLVHARTIVLDLVVVALLHVQVSKEKMLICLL